MAWESLVDTHVTHAATFVNLLAQRETLEDALARYLLEMDLGDSMAAAVRTRVLVALEGASSASDLALDGAASDGDAAVVGDDEPEGWRRFRPDVVVRGIMERQRRDEETDGWVQLAIARAEEAIITTHVDNAITFAALLEEYLPLDRAVQQYVGAVVLTGGRAQAVYQRTMARLADVHLPQTAAARV
jgi:hypothetical protein